MQIDWKESIGKHIIILLPEEEGLSLEQTIATTIRSANTSGNFTHLIVDPFHLEVQNCRANANRIGISHENGEDSVILDYDAVFDEHLNGWVSGEIVKVS